MTDGDKGDSFNPCSNGSCSPRPSPGGEDFDNWNVLILVLMEVAHRAAPPLAT